jgi:tRNA (guanine-N7-)-methyltransferase
MGKGRFLMDLARQNPEMNYVGIEKYSSVLLRAIEKQQEEELPNVRFIRMDAENITKVFGPQEVDRIYLNFSDCLKN